MPPDHICPEGGWPQPQDARHSKERYQHLSREHLQQLDEHLSIPQVLVEVGDATGLAGQV